MPTHLAPRGPLRCVGDETRHHGASRHHEGRVAHDTAAIGPGNGSSGWKTDPMTTRTQQRSTPRWVLVFLAALIAALAAILSGTTASASAAGVAETRVGAFNVAGEVLVGPPEHIPAGQRLGEAAPGPGFVVATGVAAKSADEVLGALSYSTKIEGQMAARGWTKEAIETTIQNPTATHTVWDLTSGTKQAATAYVQRGAGYVVLNDETRAVVQISNLNKTGWKPVWEDPRFMR